MNSFVGSAGPAAGGGGGGGLVRGAVQPPRQAAHLMTTGLVGNNSSHNLTSDLRAASWASVLEAETGGVLAGDRPAPAPEVSDISLMEGRRLRCCRTSSSSCSKPWENIYNKDATIFRMNYVKKYIYVSQKYFRLITNL